MEANAANLFMLEHSCLSGAKIHTRLVDDKLRDSLASLYSTCARGLYFMN